MLSIVNVAYPFAPVSADPVGGAEQIVASLDRALLAAGHRSTLIACAGSTAAQRLCAVPAHAGLIDAPARTRVAAATREAIEARASEGDVDVVHLHGIDFLDYLPRGETPVAVTLHLPLAWYPPEALRPGAPFHRVCVSESQRARAEEAAGFSVIPNGIALDRFQPSPIRAGHAVVLGRICPEKGIEVALAAAHLARAELIIAGAVFPYAAHERYFAEVVSPLLDERRRFIGPVAGAAKSALLGSARCLLVPSRVDETSSLVAMEALASGTPVIALAHGALPEIVEHGRTGFLVRDEVEMAEAIGRAAELRPERCRASAEARFSSAEMIRRYLALYATLARREGSSRSSRPANGANESVSAAPNVKHARPKEVSVEEVHDEARLRELAPAWGALCDAHPRMTPFQRPEWLLAWSATLPRGSWHALAVWQGAELLGLLPLCSDAGTLFLAGTGVTDYLDLICRAGAEQLVARASMEHLAGSTERWEALDFDALRADSPLLTVASPSGTSDVVSAAAPSPVTALPLAREPRKLAYYRRRLEKSGRVAWRLATPESAGELLQALFELHAARWRSRGQDCVLAHPAVQQFHRAAAPALGRRGLLRMHALELDDRLVAILYGFADHGRFFFYLSGFDPELSSASPGVLLVARAMECAAREGATEFDFLRGREPYKYAWGARDRAAWRRRIHHA